MTGFFEMVPGAVDLSAAAEAGISEEMAATTAAGAAALTGVMPMASDADSIEFAAALNAAGAAYLATAAEHVGQRAGFSGAQGLASATTVATDGLNAAATALGG
ncbi:PE family protein [Mycobacterium sp. 1423905.2]|uniref:PE family protein n=1 Tax=Mycobacterium sp. 1423905.2 TaxID=1856859 RepID=UPI000A941817|nr:PE family protein [Mycobacterium sp. 1423905.2]